MNKRLFWLNGLTLTFMCAFLLASGERANTYETRTLVIRGLHRIYVEPSTVVVAKDTVVTWMNLTRGPEARLTINDNKQCQTAKELPTGFELEKSKTCNVSQLIPYGRNAHIRFLDPGTYDYEIEGAGRLTIRGEIIVE